MTEEQGQLVLAALADIQTRMDALGILVANLKLFAGAVALLLVLCLFFLAARKW